MVLLLFSENVRKPKVFQCFATPGSGYIQNGRRAGEEVWQPSGGQPRIHFSGCPFLFAFRCGGVTNKNWLWGPRHQISLTKRKGTERSRFCAGGRAAQIPEKCNTDATPPRSKRKSPPMPDEATEILAPPGSGSRRS